MVPLIIPIDMRQRSNIGRGEYIAPAVNDAAGAAFIHSLMCGAAIHRFVMGVGALDDILYHKAESVVQINANLSNPKLCVHDNNIAAVFNLLNIEESLLAIVSAGGGFPGLACDPKQKVMHEKGLTAMIDQRGGIGGLSGRCLQAFILWSALAHSSVNLSLDYQLM